MDHVWVPRLEINRVRRVRTRPVLQMEAAECGAASLAMVFAYHRLFLSLERLREECGVSRDGTNAARLLKVARQYGFKVSGFRKEPEELAELPLPAIIHWGFDHFVVLEGIGGEMAWINDPARGRRAVTRDEFDRQFTGPVLVMSPGADFRPQGSPPRMFPVLWEWLAGSRRAVVFLLIVGLFLVIPGVAIPVFSQVFVDQILATGNTEWVGPLFIGVGITALGRGLLTWVQRDALARLSYRLIADLSSTYLWRAMRLPFPFFLARHPGDVAARVEIGDRLSWLLSGDLPAMALSALMVVFYAFGMFYLEPGLAALACSFALLAFLVDRRGAFYRAEKADQLALEQARLVGVSAAGLQIIETLKANGVEARFFEKWSIHQSRVMNAWQSLIFSSECLSATTRYLHSIGMLAVLGVGALRVMEGGMSVGTLVAFQSLMTSFLLPLSELAGFAARTDEIRPLVARFCDVLDHPSGDSPDDHLSFSELRFSRLRGQVEFRDVTFGYDPLRLPILTGFCFSASPGSRIAIVGRTGSGKSTVARLMAGLFSPWSGEVLFDGRPRREIAPEALASSIATVEQEIHLFEGTIAENLALWDPSISREAMERAIHDACLGEMVERLPEGLETRVAEGGRNFSGGERQRLEIARALARDPAILVLDEATSALDPETERRIYERLHQRGCTCIIVAHRLSAVRDCDEILVLDSGQVVQRGRHAGLWQAEGAYRDLILAGSEDDPS